MISEQKKMNCIIFAYKQENSKNNHVTDIMTPILGMSILQRGMIHISKKGCKKVMIYIDSAQNPIKEFLGNGERWGLSIDYQFVEKSISKLDILTKEEFVKDENYFITNINCLEIEFTDKLNTVWYKENTVQEQWSGVGFFAGLWLKDNLMLIEKIGKGKIDLSAAMINFEKIEEEIIYKNDSDFLNKGKKILDEICNNENIKIIGKESNIHKSVEIIQPCYIGKWVRISKGCKIGPYAIIEDGSIIDIDSCVSNSVVLENTYVGEKLEIHNAIVGNGKISFTQASVYLDNLEDTFCRSVNQSNKNSSSRGNFFVSLLARFSENIRFGKTKKSKEMNFELTSKTQTFHIQ
jgi:NDP-sugar pyrophosphorylase family protein